MPIAVCPNCRGEFIVRDEITGKCPYCGIKLLFRGKDEIIEKIDIEEIEKRVDEITKEDSKKHEKDIIKILIDEEYFSQIEEEVDKL
ncbi:MAG: hypothetical protein H5T45_01265 [Thermoplasmatales archaeon]|nr:hypothetical protein [Thermoplasmatales archaeon]